MLQSHSLRIFQNFYLTEGFSEFLPNRWFRVLNFYRGEGFTKRVPTYKPILIIIIIMIIIIMILIVIIREGFTKARMAIITLIIVIIIVIVVIVIVIIITIIIITGEGFTKRVPTFEPIMVPRGSVLLNPQVYALTLNPKP